MRKCRKWSAENWPPSTPSWAMWCCQERLSCYIYMAFAFLFERNIVVLPVFLFLYFSHPYFVLFFVPLLFSSSFVLLNFYYFSSLFLFDHTAHIVCLFVFYLSSSQSLTHTHKQRLLILTKSIKIRFTYIPLIFYFFLSISIRSRNLYFSTLINLY